jgi:hypothetical protein
MSREYQVGYKITKKLSDLDTDMVIKGLLERQERESFLKPSPDFFNNAFAGVDWDKIKTRKRTLLSKVGDYLKRKRYDICYWLVYKIAKLGKFGVDVY